MVADASEVTFAKYYHSIMPLLLNVLRNANGAEYRKMRLKAMECAGLIAIAVGRDMFRPDSTALVELLIRIQSALFSDILVERLSLTLVKQRVQWTLKTPS
jgi:hypothetical protein